jgi:hypothetical protein
MSLIVYPQGTVQFNLTATQSVAVLTADVATVSRIVGYPNQPNSKAVLGTVAAATAPAQTVFGPYTGGATIVIDAGAAPVFYDVGVAPQTDERLLTFVQADPVALNATGAVTAAAMLGGLVTSTTAAAVAGTVPTGTVMDAASTFAINDSFDWSVIATGANAFTVTAATDHTLVGTMAVATATSGRFRTRKTAAATFVTYRIS